MPNVVKPIIIERNGVDLAEPTEISVSNDLIQALGVAYAGSASYKTEKVGGVIVETIPNFTEAASYLTNGDLDFIETDARSVHARAIK